MTGAIAHDLPFEYKEYSHEQAVAMNADEPLKLEIIDEIEEGEPISTYRHGDFEEPVLRPSRRLHGQDTRLQASERCGGILARGRKTADASAYLRDGVRVPRGVRRAPRPPRGGKAPRPPGARQGSGPVFNTRRDGARPYHLASEGRADKAAYRRFLEGGARPGRLRARVHAPHWALYSLGDERSPGLL